MRKLHLLIVTFSFFLLLNINYVYGDSTKYDNNSTIISSNLSLFEFDINMTCESNSGEGLEYDFISSWYPEAIRWRKVTIHQAIFDITSINKNDLIELNLFDDELVIAVIENVYINVLGTKTISGYTIDYSYGIFIITITEDNCLITICIPERNQLFITQLDNQNNVYYLIETDSRSFQKVSDAESLIPPYEDEISNDNGDEISKDNVEILSAETISTINVMIVYTPAAKNWASNNGGINNIISQAMANNQLTLDNSVTYVNMNLVYAMEVSYAESGNSETDLNRLTSTTDGYMDNVHTYRNEYGADLVQLLEVVDDVGGIGWLLNTQNGLPSYGFSLVRVQQVLDPSYSAIHEIGHNLGCDHHKQQIESPGPGLYSYSAGWRWIGAGGNYYCTVMTYAGGEYFPDKNDAIRVPYFSNPNVYYGGYLTGHITDGDNARTIRNVRTVVAKYRNLPPVANNDNYVTAEDTTKTVTASGLLTNDNDDGDPLTAVKVSNPAHGTVTINSNGSFVYIPSSNYFGSDSFTYKVYDGTVYSNVATVYITITAVNDAPVVGDIPNKTTTEGSTFTLINLDNYVSDVDNTDAEMTWAYSGNSQLTVSIVNRIATITTPNLDWYGSETITFKATDSGALWDDDVAIFTVNPVNDAPVVSGISDQVILEGLSFATISLDNYVSDVDNTDAEMTWAYSGNSQLTVNIVNRTVTITTPNVDWYGSETITFKAKDPGNLYSQDTVIFIVNNVNDFPVVSGIPNQTILEGLTFTKISLDNYVSDVDNNDIQINWTYSGNSHLMVSIVSRVATISIPDINWYGTETITFNATDPLGLWDTDTAIFAVNSVNDPPVANDDTTIVIEDSSDNQINVRANDTDIEGNTLTIVSVTQPAHGLSSTNGNYVYYTPTANYSGSDSFTYTINDGHGGNDTAIVRITVTGVNDPPAANFNFEPINPEAHETVFFTSTSSDSDGTISNYTWDFGDGNKSYTQKPTHQYADNDSYLIKLNVADNNGLTSTVQKTILVSPNESPTLTNPSPANGSTNVQLSANLSWTGGDPNYDIVTYDVYFGTTSSPNKIKSNQSGTTYDPGPMDFNTTYYWKIVAWDSHGEKTTRIWHFTSRTNDPPIANANSYSINEDTTLSIAAPGVLGNDDDIDDDPLTAVKVSNTIHGSVTLNSNGSLTYVPTANYYGSDTFSYKVYDGFVYSTVVNVTITINAVNDPPVFGTPSPGNGSTTTKLSLIWSIPINDIEGNNFSWTIQCSNGQTNSSAGQEANGTKTLALLGLAYSTTYKVWVNSTDPTSNDGSGLYARKWYTFTPKQSSGGGSTGGGGEASDEPPNKKPIANASAGEPYQGFVNTAILFNGLRSNDPDGNITKWFWVFGDNTNGTGETVWHTYLKAGTYTVTLTVTDNEGATHTDTTTCVIKQQNKPPAKPFITGPIIGIKNTLYSYTVSSTDPNNDTIQYTFNWGDSASLPQSSGFLPNGSSYTVNHSWAAAGRYEITATVTDNQTESTSEITVYIDAEQISDIGYLLDDNGDGIYDAFYSEVSKQISEVQEKDGNYNIDSDGNGEWDFTFDEIKGLTSYQEPKTPGFELAIGFSAIVVALFLWRKKRSI